MRIVCTYMYVCVSVFKFLIFLIFILIFLLKFTLLTRSRTSLEAFHTSIPFILPLDHNGTRTDAKIARWRFRIPAQYQIGAIHFDSGTTTFEILNWYDPGQRTPF